MTDPTSPALKVSLDHFNAWTGGDFAAAMSFVAEEIVCHTPTGVLHGSAAYADFMGPFAGICQRADLLAGYGDDTTALIMYDTATLPVDDAPGAELHTVTGGKITAITIIFDRLPFAQARQAAAAAEDRGAGTGSDR